jgi:hypothetical protein
MAKRGETTGQQSLTAKGKYRGSHERAASADLVELRQLGSLPPGTASIQAGYRSLGRAMDQAEAEGNSGRLGWLATQQLRLRQELGISRPQASGDNIGEALAAMSAAILDTA